MDTGIHLGESGRHRREVSSIAVSTDGRRLVSVSGDQTGLVQELTDIQVRPALSAATNSLPLDEAVGDEAAPEGSALAGDASLQGEDADQQTESASFADVDDVLEHVIDGIERNYSGIHSARLTIEEVTISPDVERRETLTTETSNGAILTYSVAPVWIGRSELTLRGSDLRSDTTSRVGDDWELTGVTIHRDDVWTLYHLEQQWAQIKPTDDLHGRSPIDPRQFGAGDWRFDLVEQIRNQKVIEVTRDGDADDARLRLLTEFHSGSDTVRRRIYEFDPSRNYLPTLVANLKDDGRTVNDAVEIDYQEVIPGTAWFFRDLSQKFFTDENTGDASGTGWRQQVIWRTVGKVHINEEIPDEVFHIEFPEGTRVVDQVDR